VPGGIPVGALEHIEPIVDFEMAKYRIAYGPEALVACHAALTG
jgi:hypothetical protein